MGRASVLADRPAHFEARREDTEIFMNGSFVVAGLPRSLWGDFYRSRYALFVFEVVFKLAEAWLLVPALAVVLAAALAGAGRIAVSNLDILSFLFTPAGLLYAALFVTFTVALVLLEQAGIMALVSLERLVRRPPVRQILGVVLR